MAKKEKGQPAWHEEGWQLLVFGLFSNLPAGVQLDQLVITFILSVPRLPWLWCDCV